MDIRENEPLKGKTTMRIGGVARYFAELHTEEDVEEAYRFAQTSSVPMVVLGAGSNTIFAEGTIEALVVRISANTMKINEDRIFVHAGKNLAMLINELAEQGLDLSALTGIPGTVGGAVVGNAGQGPEGTWFDTFIEEMTIFHKGAWRTLQKEKCKFSYRDSIFKQSELRGCIVWKTTFSVPRGNPQQIKTTIEELLKRRIETQPHAKTAGSCFKALPDGTPAWKLIDEAGLRGLKVGGIQISEKHANFLINERNATFDDVLAIIQEVQKKIPKLQGVEMQIIDKDGNVILFE
ncbi:MAG: UDP-N-acetylmuramate dehydrogenase [Candidatus Peribacteraceae bacterium]|jgi:UDP-N-acetylmuramate dehydrogenase